MVVDVEGEKVDPDPEEDEGEAMWCETATLSIRAEAVGGQGQRVCDAEYACWNENGLEIGACEEPYCVCCGSGTVGDVSDDASLRSVWGYLSMYRLC